ncbi:MAG: zinc ribbon domain-containing protein [Pleurocapsa sp.]
MAYRVNLSSSQQLTIVNQGNQTSISLISSSPGQQQSQNNSFTTGNWTALPQLYQIASSFILHIQGDRSEHYILIQANSISTIAPPSLNNAIKIDLENIPDPPQNNPGFKMSSMQPMKMGNMSMDINRMSMQMDNMSMTMGKGKTPTSTKRFCSQCGQEAKISDRFCSSCGHQLDR